MTNRFTLLLTAVLIIGTHILANAQCEAVSDCFFNDFEQETVQELPACWTVNKTPIDVFGVREGQENAHSGSQYILAYTLFRDGSIMYISIPQLQDIDGSYSARMFLQYAGLVVATGAPVEVAVPKYTFGTMTDPNDPLTFVALPGQPVIGTDFPDNYTEVTSGNIPATANAYFTIRTNATTQHTAMYIEDFSWEKTDDPACAQPVSDALSVQLASFEGQHAQGVNRLSWTTQQERNHDHFEIQHATSPDGDFAPIGQLISSDATQHNNYREYIFEDTPNVATTYYRIKSVAEDGTFDYSPVISVIADNDTTVRIFPNPVTDQLYINWSSSKEEVSIAIYDILGQLVQQQSISSGTDIQLSTSNLSRGTYLVRWKTTSGQEHSQTFVKR
ncbi:MAG: T9SS type A sorting domain-containing protein [Bacteroidota bacterium]